MKNLYAFLLSLGYINSNSITFHKSDSGWVLGECPHNDNPHFTFSTYDWKKIGDNLIKASYDIDAACVLYVWDFHPHNGRPMACEHRPSGFIERFKTDRLEYFKSNKWMIGCEVKLFDSNQSFHIKKIVNSNFIKLFGVGIYHKDTVKIQFIDDDGSLLSEQEYLMKYYGFNWE